MARYQTRGMGIEMTSDTFLLDGDQCRTEIYNSALEWLVDNPGAENLPLHLFRELETHGLDPVNTEFKLLMERDKLND
jgi:hypothetical protein